MTECNKTVTIDGLPTREGATSDDFLIVHKAGQTSKVKVSDFVLGADNVDFYPDIATLMDRITQLETLVATNSGNWNSTYTTTQTNSAQWSTLSTEEMQTIRQTLNQNTTRWNNAANIVENSYTVWNTTTDSVTSNSDNWSLTVDLVSANSDNWSTAYENTQNGMAAIHEALETIETSPWFQLYVGSNSPAYSVYTTVNQNSANW